MYCHVFMNHSVMVCVRGKKTNTICSYAVRLILVLNLTALCSESSCLQKSHCSTIHDYYHEQSQKDDFDYQQLPTKLNTCYTETINYTLTVKPSNAAAAAINERHQ